MRSRLWQPMVVVAALFMVISVVVDHFSHAPLSDRALYALRIETLNRARVISECRDSVWRSVDCEVIYEVISDCDSLTSISPGEELIYYGSVTHFGRRGRYIQLREEGIVERVDRGVSLQHRINEALFQRLRGVGLSAESESVVATMLLSRDDGMTRELKGHYRRGGVAHILAVSGLHVSIVSLLLFVMLSPMALLFRGDRLRIVAVVALLWLFAYVNYMGASVERATIMYTLFLIGTMVLCHYDSLMILATSVVVMCIADVSAPLNVGFQLSFTALLSIILWVNPLWRHRPRWMRNVVGEVVFLPMLLALSCSAATLPIICYHFGSYSVVGFLTAPIIYLSSFLILLLSLLALMIGVPPLRDLLRDLLEWVVGLQNGVVRCASELQPDQSDVSLSGASLAIIYLLYAGATIYVKEKYKDKSL